MELIQFVTQQHALAVVKVVREQRLADHQVVQAVDNT
jgi:hypothetical protein